MEAVSEDGAVEAISVKNAHAFAVGVQFHPEWGTATHKLYSALFGAFGEAIRARAAARNGPRFEALNGG